ncbi:MAG TPA: hypothetical protein VKV32_00440 [Stellaceae bacterium]|nr:hypothetical protein [Stellaceae bacterium]
MLVYGAITLAVAAGFSCWRRSAVIAVGAAFIAGIGVSRLIVHAHSIPEVLVGSLVGIAALALFARPFLGHSPPPGRLRPLLAACALLMVLLHGQDLRAEDMLHAIGLYLNGAGMVCL